MGYAELIPPFFSTRFLPQEDLDGAVTISTQLSHLALFVTNFRSAIDLSAFSQQQEMALRNKSPDDPQLTQNTEMAQMVGSWQLVAARDGVMTIFHISESMDGVTSTLRLHCPTLEKLVSQADLKAVKKTLAASFPNFETIRDVVAHRGQTANSPRRKKKYETTSDFDDGLVKIENSQFTIMDSLHGNRYTTSVMGGAIVSYEVTAESYYKLRDIVAAFFKCFDAAVIALQNPLKLD